MRGVEWRLMRVAALVGTVGLLAGCDEDEGSTGPGGQGQANLGFVVASSDASPGEPGLTAVDAGGSELTFISAALVLADVELDLDAGGEEVLSEDLTVNLALDGGMNVVLSSPVQAELYDEVDADVEELRLIGLFNGELFDITIPLEAKLGLDLDPEVRVPSNGITNVVVTVDLTSFFVGADGLLFGPAQALADDALRARLAANVEGACEAFEDRNLDGLPG